MTIQKVSTWIPYYRNKPTAASPLPLNEQRANAMALLCFTTAGCALGWNYTNSVTLGEASPGTASQPARMYWKRGSGIATEIIKAALTYDASGNPTKIVLYYSNDNGNTYANMTDEDGNYVLTQTFDASNNLTASTWGKTP